MLHSGFENISDVNWLFFCLFFRELLGLIGVSGAECKGEMKMNVVPVSNLLT